MSNRSLRARAIAGGKWTAFSALVAIGTQILQLVVLGRLLGPKEFGVMSMMMVVIGFATSIADFGFANYLIHLDLLSRSILNRLLINSMVLSMLLSICIYFLTSSISSFFGAPELAIYLPWLGIIVILTTVAQMSSAILQKELMFSKIAIIEICSAIISLLIAIVLAVFGYGVWALVFGQISSAITRLVIATCYAMTIAEKLPKHVTTSGMSAKTFGLFQVGERFLNFVSISFDKIIIGKYLGEQALGVYSVAFQLVLRPIMIISPIFNRVALPIFAKIKHDNERLSDGYLEILKTIAMLLFPIYLTMCLSAPAIVTILLGEKWQEATPILSILSLLGLAYSIGNPIGGLVIAKGRADWALYLNLLSVFVNITASYLGSQISLEWVAIFLVLGAWLILFPLEFYLRLRLVGMRFKDYFVALRSHFIGAFIPLLIYFSLPHFGFFLNSYSQILIFNLFAILFFICCMYFLEKKLIINTFNLLGIRTIF